MDKKELKLYVTPAQEIIDLELGNQILAGSTNANGVTTDPIENPFPEEPEEE
jgi:hypothetical protein